MEKKEKFRLKMGLILTAAVLFLSWDKLQPVTRPLLTGLCLALFLDPLRALLEKFLLRPLNRFAGWQKIRRPVSVTLTFLLAGGGTLLLLWRAGPRLVESAGQALSLLPSLGQSVGEQAEALTREISAQTGGRFTLDLGALSSELLGGVVPTLTNAADQMVNCGGTLLLGVIFAAWMLLKKEAAFALFSRTFALFPSMEEELLGDGRLCRQCFSAFVKGQLTEAVILGAGCFVGMLIFHKPFAGLISLIIGMTALVPVAGALAGGAFGTVILFSSSPADGLWFLIFIVLLQQLENNLIYPRVMGHSVGLPAALVLLAVLLGGTLFGIPGMLLLVPAASAVWRRAQIEMDKAAKGKKPSGPAEKTAAAKIEETVVH